MDDLMHRNREILRKLEGTAEPYFVLRAQDKLAVDAVVNWIKNAVVAGVDQSMVAHALDIAQAMRAWPKKKLPD